jgi:hypothetical protein
MPDTFDWTPESKFSGLQGFARHLCGRKGLKTVKSRTQFVPQKAPTA